MAFLWPRQHPSRTFCRICEAACGLIAELDALGQPVRLRPDRAHPVSRGFVCAKGTRFLEVAEHPDRLLVPRYRRADGQYAPCSWPAAMQLLAQRLRPVLARYGPHAVGIYFGNPLAFNALGSLTMLAFMRALGTRNVFTAGSQDCNNKFAGAQILHGSPLLHPIPDFAHTDLAILLGTNPAVSQSSFVHLEGGSTVFDRLLRRGGRLLWVDPRRTESAQRWGEHLPIKPGTDIFLLLALLHALRDRYAPHAHIEGLGTLLDLAAAYPAARAAALTGIPQGRLETLAQQIRTTRRVTYHMSVGINQGPFGTLCYIALQALAYLSGQFDQPGGLLFHPLAVRLAALIQRFTHDSDPVYSRIGHVASLMGTLPGGILADEILTPGPAQIRALIVVAGDPVRSIPGEAKLRQAMHTLDFTVCLDLFQNTTGHAADLLLPTTSWLERGDVAGSTMFFHSTPWLQYTGPVRRAPGETRTETRILADMSLALSTPLFGSHTLTRLWRRVEFVTARTAWLQRLGLHSLPSPRPRPGRYLGRGPVTPGHRVRFWHPTLLAEAQRLAAHAAQVEAPPSGWPATLALLCRRRPLGHNGWLHGAVPYGKTDHAAWLAPGDFQALGLLPGDTVVVQTDTASLAVPALAVAAVLPGTIVIPHGLPEANVNALLPTGPASLEPLSGQHRMSGIAVRVTPAPRTPR